jgi:hypothetical protein
LFRGKYSKPSCLCAGKEARSLLTELGTIWRLFAETPLTKKSECFTTLTTAKIFLWLSENLMQISIIFQKIENAKN